MDPIATRSASPSAAPETRSCEPSTAAADVSEPVGAAERLRDPDRYQIINEHGRGGLGRVSRARDRDLGRDVAIKELISRGPISEARFLREALITARLEHPGIVPVHEAGRWPDGTPFYAMKLVAGRPLRDLIVERTTVDERIALLHHVIAVADAIAYAHGRNIIHRDLKPANVIIGDFGETIVIDWGLAKDLSGTEEIQAADGSVHSNRDTGLTSAGSILGTPTYMAPEQARGEHVDQRADVFAIGAMLWELCSLQRVPPSDPVRRHRMLRRAGIDNDLVAIIDKAIDPDPRHRYRDAGALAADLKAFKSGARITARSYSLFAMLAHWTRRHRRLALSAIAFVVLASILARVALLRREAEQEAGMAQQETRMAKQVADISVTLAAVEQGRQALLHGESAEATTALTQAYQRGDHSPGVAFMLARALQPRLAERARFTSTAGRMWSAAFSPDGNQIVTTDDQNAQVWNAKTNQRLFTLPHGNMVYDAIYSADGARLITATHGLVGIWDAASGTLVRELKQTRNGGKPRDYLKVALSPDGTLVAANDWYGEVSHVWDTRTGAPVAELRNDGAEFATLAFSANGRWLGTSGGDVVHLFDTTTWKLACTLAARHVRRIAFDPTGPRLVTGTSDGDASIWEIPGGTRLHHLREIGEPVDSVAWSPNGEIVATAARDGAEQVWDARSGRLQSQGNWHRSKISSVEFDPTSTLLVAAGTNGAVVVSDVALGMPIAVLEGAESLVRVAHFDRTSRRVVAASNDGTARVWDATPTYRYWSSSPVGTFCGYVSSLEPDRRFVAIGCWDHETRVWDTARDQLLAELPPVTRVDGDFTSAFPAVSAEGDRAAIARGNAVVVYELPGGTPIRTVMHGAAVSAVAFAPTGHDLVSGSIDGALLVTHDDRASIALPRSPAGIDAATILSDGRVVAADARSRLRFYDPGRNDLLADLQAPSRARLLRPSPDGRRLITVPDHKKDLAPPVLWDLAHYRRIAQIEGHLGGVFTARFVAGGTEILTAGTDGTARQWNAETGRLEQTYRGSTRFLGDATLSPDGTMVVGAGGDGLLRFWDTSNQRLLWTIPAHKPHVVGVHFEGADIVTRGFDGDVSRWRLPRSEDVIDAHARLATVAAGQPK